MSVLTKAKALIAHVSPDRPADELRFGRRLIGQPLDRLDGHDKVTGAARFSAEYPFANVAHAALAFSSIACGTIESIDTEAARAAPGVVCVITHENAPPMKTPPLFDPQGGTDAAGSSTNVVNTDVIEWNGQPLAVVVAETLDQAEEAAALIRVAYLERPGKTSFAAAKADAVAPENVMGEDTEVKRGDAELSLASASFKVDHRYTTPRYNHNAIEPHATTASWQDDELTVYNTSQFIRGAADTLAKIFGLKKQQVRVLSPFVGGGFGGKGAMWSHTQLCVLAAKVAERPVRLALTRKGVFLTVGGRTPSDQRVALAADAQGKLTALIHTGITATSTNNAFAEQFSFPARHLYAAPNFHIAQKVTFLNSTANTFMRAPGESIGSFALESAMDELSYVLDIDPIQLRLANEPHQDPVKGWEFSSRHLAAAYRLGAEKFGWISEKRVPGSMRDGEWLIGHGVATAYYPVYRFPASIRLRLNREGTVVIQSGAHEMGMGTRTAQTQAAAERLGLPMASVLFEYGSTDFPDAPQAGGSAQTISLVLGVSAACEVLEKELLALVHAGGDTSFAHAKATDVECIDGALVLKQDNSVRKSFRDILAQGQKEFLEVNATSPQAKELMKYSMGSYGAQFCEVRVNRYSGEVRVARWVGAFDCGRVLNAKLAHSQFAGGIIMGIGMALTEEALFDDRSGRIVNPSLAEYHVPVHADIPLIESYYLDIPDPKTPLGAHGIGEIGITGVAAALASAIYHATGKRVRDLPITLDKLL